MRPIIIGVGGAHSGVGKTTYASALISSLRGWGAIKYTKTGLYSSIIDDRALLSEEGKDTKRLLDAGADAVLWVKAPPSELPEVLPAAVERLSNCTGILVEGNSAIEFLRPDIIIFISGSGAHDTKDSARRILSMAHVVVSREGINPAYPGKTAQFQKSPDSTEQLIAYVTAMVETIEQIRSSLRRLAPDGRISCAAARKIAEDLHVSYGDVGKAANELKIKIIDCELGCF